MQILGGLIFLAVNAPGNLLHATALTIAANDTGWYNSVGVALSGNYIAGSLPNSDPSTGTDYHNYLVFDLSLVSQPIRNATVRLYNDISPPNRVNGFRSPDPFETYAVFEVTTDPTVLKSHLEEMAIYDDLADGKLLGSVDVTTEDNGEFVEVSLNADGVEILNAATGLLAFGGAITTLSPNTRFQETVFAGSHIFPDVHLVVE